MSGIGSIVSAWNALQPHVDRTAQRSEGFDRGASGLLSALRQVAEATPDASGSGEEQCCCACMFSPPSMSALIAAQDHIAHFETSACASIHDFLDEHVESSMNDGAGVAQNLFALLDTDGDGAITRSEFDGALAALGFPTAAETNVPQPNAGNAGDQAGANDTSSAPSIEGSASPAEGDVGTSPANATGNTGDTSITGGSSTTTNTQMNGTLPNGVAQSAQMTAPTTTETANPNGSTTTTITYPDGTTVTLTSPPGSDAAPGAGDSSEPAMFRPSLESALAALIRLQAQMTESVAT